MTTRDETYEDDFYEDDYYDEDDSYEVEAETEDLQEDARVGLIARAMAHPHLSMGGGTLAASVVVDLLTRFDPFAVVFGLAAAGYLAVKGPDMANGIREMLIPGSNTEQVRADAMQFANRLAPNSVEYEEQGFIAKMRRLFVGDKNDAVVEDEEESEQEDTPLPHRREVRKLPPMRTQTQRTDAHGPLTLDLILDFYRQGRINEEQFIRFFDTLSGRSVLRRSGRSVEAEAPSEADADTKKTDTADAEDEVTVIGDEFPNDRWTPEKAALIVPLWRTLEHKNIDDVLKGLGIPKYPDNRGFVKKILIEAGEYKEGR